MHYSLQHKKDTITISGEVYALEAFRQFLMERYPLVVKPSFLKAVDKSGTFVSSRSFMREGRKVQETTLTHSKVEFQYDWQDVLSRVGRAIFPLYDFIQSYGKTTSK